MNFIDEIEKLIPRSASDEVDWDKTGRLLASTCFSDLRTTLQNPVYHGEGDVYAHTQMVCSELIRHPAYAQLPGRQRTELFLAALLHDLGKAKTTRMANGVWTSPHHASVGSRMVREFLWRDCGLCGRRDLINFRETVCALVRHHMLPVHLMNQDHPERRVREVASAGELASDFSWKLLCMLAEADVKGRIAEDIEESLSQVQLAKMMAEEARCLDAPYRFPDGFTKRSYLSGRNVPPDQALYDDSWGEVILLSGLPGTGKDTWIREHRPEMPTVSLDDIRREKGIKPTDNQGEVIQAAQERAREYLRKKQPFIWNATNLSKDTRQKLIGLFERYGARARIVYLETDWEVRIDRNRSRIHSVPEAAVGRMLEKTVLPMPEEAQTVEWTSV